MSDRTGLTFAGDALTAKALVVVQDRPIVAYVSWLASGLRECAESGRALQIVTPAESRLSLPMRTVLTGQRARWVVRPGGSDAGGYYDGLSGAPLQWDGTSFVQVPGGTDYAPGFLARPTTAIGSQLTITLRIRYGPNDQFGGAVEKLCVALHGALPAGWGTFEPATQPWNREELTQLCQRRQSATWLTYVGSSSAARGEGRPTALIGTAVYTPIQGGFEESATLVVGYPANTSPPVTWVPALAGEIAAEQELLSLSAQLGPAPADLTTEPRWVGSASPLGLAVSAELGGGSAVPPDIPVGQLGSVWWYDLGDGRSPDAWQRYQRLAAHLKRR